MSVLLSILIPTKNRYKYLSEAIKVISNIDSLEFEVIIQDNSEDNVEFLAYLRSINYTWLKYFYVQDKLSSVQNYDAAILNSSGEYVCFIGDDDSIITNIIDCVKWMKMNDIDALRSAQVDYYWPETGKYGGLLSCENTMSTYSYLDPYNELMLMLKNGCQNLGKIPLLYMGIVKRVILDEIFKIQLTFFPGASADIANGVALCFYVKKYIYVYIPIVITGTSKMTGGGVYFKKNKSMNLEQVPFISEKTIQDWEKNIPPIWSGCLVWPESAIKALKACNKQEYISRLNRELMLASFAFANSSWLKLSYKYSNNKLKFIGYYLFLYIRIVIIALADRLVKFVTRNKKTFGRNLYYNNESIIIAEHKMHEICKKYIFSNLTLIK